MVTINFTSTRNARRWVVFISIYQSHVHSSINSSKVFAMGFFSSKNFKVGTFFRLLHVLHSLKCIVENFKLTDCNSSHLRTYRFVHCRRDELQSHCLKYYRFSYGKVKEAYGQFSVLFWLLYTYS